MLRTATPADRQRVEDASDRRIGDRLLIGTRPAVQLRHTRATLIRQAYGLEAAKAVLGHADTKVTEIYAERDLGLAMRIMREIG